MAPYLAALVFVLTTAMGNVYADDVVGELKQAGKEVKEGAIAAGNAISQGAKDGWEATKQGSQDAWEEAKKTSNKVWNDTKEGAENTTK